MKNPKLKIKRCEDFLQFTKTITSLDIPIINLWRFSKENKSFSDDLKVGVGSENIFKILENRGFGMSAKLIENDIIKNVLTNSESIQLSLVLPEDKELSSKIAKHL